MNEARIYHVLRLFNESDELLCVSFNRDVKAHLARINDKHGWHEEVTSFSTTRVRTRKKALALALRGCQYVQSLQCPFVVVEQLSKEFLRMEIAIWTIPVHFLESRAGRPGEDSDLQR